MEYVLNVLIIMYMILYHNNVYVHKDCIKIIINFVKGVISLLSTVIKDSIIMMYRVVYLVLITVYNVLMAINVENVHYIIHWILLDA